MDDTRRAHLIMLCGIAIILLGIGSALLPAAGNLPGSAFIGSLLLISGAIEIFAGTLRQEVHRFAAAAGAVTAIAGLIFIINPTEQFFPMVTPIIAWLVIRFSPGRASTRADR